MDKYICFRLFYVYRGRKNESSRRGVLKTLSAASIGLAGANLAAGSASAGSIGPVTIWIYHDDRHPNGDAPMYDVVDQLETAFDKHTDIEHNIGVSGVYPQSYVYDDEIGDRNYEAFYDWSDVADSQNPDNKELHLWVFDKDHWMDEYNPDEVSYDGVASPSGGVDDGLFNPAAIIAHTNDGVHDIERIQRIAVHETGHLLMHSDLEHHHIYNWYDSFWSGYSSSTMKCCDADCDSSDTEASGSQDNREFGEYCGEQMELYIEHQTFGAEDNCHLESSSSSFEPHESDTGELIACDP